MLRKRKAGAVIDPPALLYDAVDCQHQNVTQIQIKSGGIVRIAF